MPPRKSSLPPHPFPPSNLVDRSLPTSTFTGPLYRLHPTNLGPIFFGRTGSHRFDAPAGQFGVLYAGTDLDCAFIETFGNEKRYRVVAESDLRRRMLSQLTPTRALRLVDLTGPGLVQIGADARLVSGSRGISQRWALALEQHPDVPDGILYPARNDPSCWSVALFDRAEGLLSATTVGSLLDPATIGELARILEKYTFGLRP